MGHSSLWDEEVEVAMRAARLEGVGALRVRAVDEPAPAADELVIRVEACGICGTDRHILHGDYPSAVPVTLGHELAGTVIATGDGALLPVGTRVAVDRKSTRLN